MGKALLTLTENQFKEVEAKVQSGRNDGSPHAVWRPLERRFLFLLERGQTWTFSDISAPTRIGSRLSDAGRAGRICIEVERTITGGKCLGIIRDKLPGLLMVH